MGKCPRCKWTGPASKFAKHFSLNHFKPKKGTKTGKVKVFKTPVFAKKKRR